MARKRVLFVCVHNSARSQMAEAYLNYLGEGEFEAESAGIEPGRLNPFAVQVMLEDGINISRNKTKDVYSLLRQGKSYTYIVTVCDDTAADRCPVFPGIAIRLHWELPDPSALRGTPEEKLAKTREVRDQIKRRIETFVHVDFLHSVS